MLSSGFFNSNNHDKKYYASDLSRLFNALITDGIFENVGNRFVARAGEGMTVIIQSGMAYFNSTWTVNDADYIVDINPAPYVTGFKRIDGIFLRSFPENAIAHRDNEIYYLKGHEVSENPEKPIPEAVEGEVFTPLCYVTVNNGDNEIQQSNIENYIGKTKAPFVTGIVETVDISDLLRQWQSQWDNWLNSKNRNYEGWFSGKETEFTEWLSEKKTAFMNWFDNLKVVLDGDVAGHLQNEIDALDPVRKRTLTNLLDPSKYAINSTLTTHGVTITNNGDGTFTVNGTTDNDVGKDDRIAINITQWASNFKIATGHSRIKFCGTPLSINKKGMLQLADINNNEGHTTNWVTDLGNGVVIDTVDDAIIIFALRFEFLPNTTFDNVVFKPMITTDLNGTYADYVEYSGGRELNENVADIVKDLTATNADLSNKVKLNGKNVNISMQLNGTSLVINTTNV